MRQERKVVPYSVHIGEELLARDTQLARYEVGAGIGLQIGFPLHPAVESHLQVRIKASASVSEGSTMRPTGAS